jgi:hypothetical protein
MTQLMKYYVKTRSAWIDADLLADGNIPSTPTVSQVGTADSPGNGLKFHCSDFSGTGAFAAMAWRAGEVVEPGGPTSKSKPQPYEITPVWESAESTVFNPNITIPSNALKTGHTYRVRARMKDASGRWSHWSAPVQFTIH